MTDAELVAALAEAMREARVGYYTTTAEILLPTVRRVAEQRAAEELERERAYVAGHWCGECRYGVIEDPPCCTQPRAAALTATPNHGRNAT